MFKLLRKQGGFTLLELLIVIVIIGLLAVLIIPNLASGPARARDSQRKSDLRNIKTAMETYYNDNNTYPDPTNWKADLAPASNPYIKTVPQDPKTKTDYTYTPAPSGCDETTTPCASYVLQATLENTRDKEIKATTTATYEITSAN
jgi:type II secretion system protein G